MSSFPFLGAAARQAHVLEVGAHRPWPPHAASQDVLVWPLEEL